MYAVTMYMYRTLAKKGPWAVHLTLDLNWGVGRYSRYRIAGNFRGRKLSRILRFYSHPRKFSPRNFRHATPIMRSVYIPRKFSPQNAPFLPIRESFLPQKFPAIRYVVMMMRVNTVESRARQGKERQGQVYMCVH